MEFEFAISRGYDETDLLLLNRLAGKRNKNSRAVDIILRGVRIVVAAVLLYAGLFSVAKDNVSTFVRVLFIVVGVVEMISGLMHNRIRAFRGKRIMRTQTGNLTVLLDDEGITEKTDAGEKTASYNDVDAICYMKERWFLFLADGHVVLLPKDCMKSESAEDFSAFLENRTGKTIETIEK